MESQQSPGGSSSRRVSSKRATKLYLEETMSWDCHMCTYRNKAEAFKCLMCDARKGTSTRKPKTNPAQLVVAQQVQAATQPKISKPKANKNKSSTLGESKHDLTKRPKLKNVDRSTATTRAITVNNITVVITEFQPKRKRTTSDTSTTNDSMQAESDNVSRPGVGPFSPASASSVPKVAGS